MKPPMPLFDANDATYAADTWGFNCGPAAVATMMGMTIEQLRPHLGDFETKRYTNPMLMWAILKSVGAKWKAKSVREVLLSAHDAWPDYGLARIQWEGPWTSPGVPIVARYRHTHWVGAMRIGNERGIFDVNCMNSGGWVSLSHWTRIMVPFILKQCHPKANGDWHLTHSIEVDRLNSGNPNYRPYQTNSTPHSEFPSSKALPPRRLL
jgi:hypothetical protein